MNPGRRHISTMENQPPADKDTYTVFYCERHDQGFVVQGHYEDDPTPAMLNASCGPNHGCYGTVFGQLVLRGNEVDDSKCRAYRVNYDRYGGGWELGMYATCVLDSNLTPIDCPQPLANWFAS
jgi:hypothetical protein